MNQTSIPDEITFVDFSCPHCGKPVSFPVQFVGRAEECPTCSQILVVPKPGEEVGAKLPIPFETARLRFRRLTPEDSSDLLEIVGDEELVRYQDWYAMDEQAVQKWLVDDQKQQLFQPEPTFYLALELLAQPKVIGFVALTLIEMGNFEVTVSMAVLINHNCQRQGFGAEAFREAMEFVFNGLNVRRLCCWCDSRNLAGVRLLEKSGLRHEGHFVKNKFMKGEWADTVQFALLQAEYCSAA